MSEKKMKQNASRSRSSWAYEIEQQCIHSIKISLINNERELFYISPQFIYVDHEKTWEKPYESSDDDMFNSNFLFAFFVNC